MVLILSNGMLTQATSTLPTVILFCVRVPVLSEHMTEVLPRVSTASNLRTRQFFFLHVLGSQCQTDLYCSSVFN